MKIKAYCIRCEKIIEFKDLDESIDIEETSCPECGNWKSLIEEPKGDN